MSDSYRKTPITGWTTSESEKRWKQSVNRRRRRAEKLALERGDDILPNPTRGEWGPKDGRQWMMKWDNPDEFDRCMRK